MGRPDYEDSIAGGDGADTSDTLYLVGDSTGSLTSSGDGSLGSVFGTLQEGDDGTP